MLLGGALHISDIKDVPIIIKISRDSLTRAVLIASLDDKRRLLSATETLAKCHTDVRVFLINSLPCHFELDTELSNISVAYLPLFASPVTLYNLQFMVTHTQTLTSSTIVHPPDSGGLCPSDLRCAALHLASLMHVLAGGAYHTFALGPRPRAIAGLMRDVAAEAAARCESDDSSRRGAHLLLLDRDADLVGPCRLAAADTLLTRALWALPDGPGPDPSFPSPLDPAARAPFEYFDKGSMATVSRHSAVAKVGPLEFSGYFAWLAWLFLHLVYLVGFKARAITAFSWLTTFIGSQRGQLTITEQQAYARTRIEQLEEIVEGVVEEDPQIARY